MSTYDQKISSGRNDGCIYTVSYWYAATSSTTWPGNNEDGFYRFINLPMGQGATIDSAYIQFWTDDYGSSNNCNFWIKATAEDSAAELPASNGTNSEPLTRPRTSAAVNVYVPGTRNVQVTSGDIKTVIQEIVNRPGWVGGGAICIVLTNNGSPYGNDLTSYEGSTTDCMRLVVNYTGISTYTKTIEATACIVKSNTDYGIRVSKPTYGVQDTDPSHFIFDSQYGTLKYHTTGSVDLTIDVLGGGMANAVAVNHNLGYIPYVEVYAMNPLGEYQPCPVFGSGASTMWKLTYKITSTQVVFYAEEGGFFNNVTFTFKYFIFKNKLTF